MKKVKSENGAITMIVLVSVIFIVSFLISSYVLISNKAQTQKDIIEETRKIYEPIGSMEEIYNSYFNNSNIVPVYTVEQLLMMGTESKNVNINGKYYNFDNDENTIYVLMNDLKFRASDYADKLNDGYWIPVGDRILEYEKLKNESSEMQEVEQESLNSYFRAKFEGKNNSIEVIYTDNDNDEYSVVYSQNSKYCEPEYEVNVIPKLSDETIAETAEILINNENKGVRGNTTVKVRRLKKTSISAYLNENYNTPEEIILIINPNKIKYINLKLESINVILTINAIPEKSKVMINGEMTNSISVPKGTTVDYKVSCDGYYTKQGNIEVNKTMELSIELAPLDYISFSEKFYFTRCSDENYNGLLNGGETTVSHYSLIGEDVSMGSFYIDESDIIKSIPSKGIINKVTLYFEYYQSRNNTTLYTNTIKTAISTGTIEKMAQRESEKTNKTVKQAKYELVNISRKDLEDGIVVNLVNYIEGTLKINSSVKNMYCVIEGEKPNI